MKIHQAYRYELKPNNRQRSLFRQCAGTARFAYNWGLAKQFEALREGGEFLNSVGLHRTLNLLKKNEFPWMYRMSKCVPQEALRNLDRAWRGKKRGQGVPRFKKKNSSKDSFRLTGIVKILGENTVQLPRLGCLRTKESTYKLKGRILSATVSREADRWFVSFSVERERQDLTIHNGKPVGVDLGISSFITISNGESVDAPKPLKKNVKKLQRLSRSVSRKQKGSSNRRKAVTRLARQHRRIKNQRLDFLHKLSTDLTKTKSIICVETLNIKGMLKNRKLSRAISDLGWSEFLRQLEYKSKWYGSEIRKIDRWFPSSKTCCVCGFKWGDLSLGIREWECPSCNTQQDRDVNASVNILLEGLTQEEFNKSYPKFSGKLRLWRSSKSSSPQRSRGTGRRSKK